MTASKTLGGCFTHEILTAGYFPPLSLRICILKGFCSSLEHIVRIHSVDGSVLQDVGLSHTDSANSDVFIF